MSTPHQARKLGHTEERIFAKGDKIVTRAGRVYRIERVSGNSVTVVRERTALESSVRALGLLAGTIVSTYRRARQAAAIAKGRRNAARLRRRAESEL